MEWLITKKGDVNVITFNGPKITSHEAPALKKGLLELIIGEGESFLLNMNNIENMDSTGLGAFLFGIRQADQHDKDMRFCCVQSKVRFLIRIAHLEDVIDVYETEEAALEAFCSGDQG